MKKEYPKRYRFIPPTMLNSIATWEEDTEGIWIKDRKHIIDVSQYQKRKINKKSDEQETNTSPKWPEGPEIVDEADVRAPSIKTSIELRNKIRLNSLSRGSVNTTMLCHELAGIIEVEDFKTIVVGLPRQYGLHFLLPMMFDVFDEHEIKYKYIKQQNKIICGDKTIYLMFTDEVEEKTRGFEEYYYQEVK